MTRIDEIARLARRRRLDAVLVCDPANVRAFASVTCDNAALLVFGTPGPGRGRPALYTDFRYAPMVRRVAPSLACRDLKALRLKGLRRVGYESSLSHARFLKLRKLATRGAAFVDVADGLLALRAVKTPEEVAKVRAAEALACEIWNEASARFRAGMTERDMARTVQSLMVARGEGESFPTIVCVGPNAAECHHEPDDTVWNGRESVLVDMGVKLGGVCSDLTRNVLPKCASRLYRQVYALVKEANAAAIAAVRPGMSGKALDKVARDVIRKGGFGKCFGHSLGHGVGYEIHEAPYASKRSADVLKPGMCVTIEPGVYLEGNLGVRIEDLVLVTETGCEVLSSAAAK